MSLSAELAAFLSNPVVKLQLEPSEEIQALREKCQYLETELNRALAEYGKECQLNMRLTDLLRENGIRWR